ncbi:Na+/H+ antiporter [Thermoleophilia bacterium SCSIO 60948]|nr:Na+/H+ antiporter [Thermoleophilia bacterium SCSIO 60948]
MHLELALLSILVAVVVLLVGSQFLRVPYPILLVIGGLGIALIPGVPEIELDPDLVLVILLPPLLYAAAFFTPLRELRRNLRAVSALAIGLVLATMTVVAVVAHLAIGLPWGPAFVLGAIVSPTDPVAATSIARRLGMPNRIVSIVEGESLVNDGTALVAYRFAVAAVVTGAFSLPEATVQFFVSGLGGVAVGIGVGAVVAFVRKRLDNPPVEVTIAIFTAYFAYLPAELLHVSGVLAAVTVGIFMGRLTSKLTTATTRIQGEAVFEIVSFILNSALFTLVGLQLPAVLEGADELAVSQLVGQGLLIAAAVIATRLAFTFPATYVPRMLSRRIRERRPRPPARETLVVAWTGMRGAVSLAAALAIPLTVDGGGAFPERDLIIFLTFSVILVTLIVQGLSLPLLIRILDLDDHDVQREREENKARLITARAVLDRLDELVKEDWVREDTVERVSGMYRYRERRFSARFADDGGEESSAIEDRSSNYQRLVHELLDAQRGALEELRNEGRIDDDVLRTIGRELDHEESRLEV